MSKPRIEQIDDAAEYRVRLSRKIVLGPDWVLYPGQEVRLSGVALIEHYDAIESAERMPDLAVANGTT